jgi:excisionase family DNA binding protein
VRGVTEIMSLLPSNVRPWRVPTEQPAGVKKLLYTKREAAFALGISVRSIDYLIATKQLEARRIGGRVLIPVKEVERFAASNHYENVTSAAPAA